MDARTRELAMLVVIGLIAGYLASLVLGGSGLVRYLVSGLIGAVVGPYVLRAANVDLKLGNPLLSQIATATIGALVVVILARLIG